MGNKQTTNTKKETITDTHRSGSTLHRDKEGNFYLYAKKDLILSASGEFKASSKKKMSIYGHDKVEMGGKDVKVAGKDDLKLKNAGGNIKHDPPFEQVGLKENDKVDPTEVGERQRPTTNDASGKMSA